MRSDLLKVIAFIALTCINLCQYVFRGLAGICILTTCHRLSGKAPPRLLELGLYTTGSLETSLVPVIKDAAAAGSHEEALPKIQ